MKIKRLIFTTLEVNEELFWANSIKHDCWLWIGHKAREGHGVFTVKHETRYTNKAAHIISWYLTYNELPKQRLIHSCGNKACIKPDHLKLSNEYNVCNDKIIDNILTKIDVKAEQECWNWLGEFHIKENGHIDILYHFRNAKYNIKRLVWQHYFNYIPKRSHIIQICKNYKCLNHKHLLHLKINNNHKRQIINEISEDKLILFLNNVDIKQDGSCWTWLGSSNAKGYGICRMKVQKRVISSSHRISFALFNNIIPSKYDHIRHLCHNKLCVNPEHLAIGTAMDNVNDSKINGNYGVKLNKEIVYNIKIDIKSKTMNLYQIAEKYNVSYFTIYDIKTRRTWRHVKL